MYSFMIYLFKMWNKMAWNTAYIAAFFLLWMLAVFTFVLCQDDLTLLQ